MTIELNTITDITNLPPAVEQASKYLSGFDREETETMGIIQYCHEASTGVVYQIHADAHTALVTLTSQTHFADGTTAIADKTIAQYHESGETQFSYWYQGELVEVTTLKTLDMSASTFGGYVRYGADGELAIATSAHEMIVHHTLLAMVYWNGDTDELLWLACERHGHILDPMAHKNLHFTTGFAHTAGCDITGIANNGSTFTEIGSGTVADEDIPSYLAAASTAPFAYKEGANGYWNFTSDDNAVGYKTTGLVWNNEDSGGAGVWGLDLIPGDTDYQIMTIWMSNNKLHPFLKIIGQGYWGSRNDARARTDSYVNILKTEGMPSQEMRPIASMIVHHRTDAKIEDGTNDEVWFDHRRSDAGMARFND